MSKEWLWWLGEFGLAAIVAVVAGFVTGDVPISILYGLFVGTVFFVLRQNSIVASRFHKEVDELEDKALNLPAILSHHQEISPYIKPAVLSAKEEALRLAKEAAGGTIVLRAPNFRYMMLYFWRMVQPEDKVVAMNYGVGWGTPELDVMRKENFELAEKGADITRIFVESITATPEDKKRLRQEMDRQKDHIKVRFVKESQLPQEARSNHMVVFNKYWGNSVWEQTLGSRIAQYSNSIYMRTNPDDVKKGQELLETVIKLSEEYK